MSTQDLRCQRNAKKMLEIASEECNEMHYDLGKSSGVTKGCYDDSILPDMDEIYIAADEMRQFADRLNYFADALMVEFRKMDSHQHLIALDDLWSESHAH